MIYVTGAVAGVALGQMIESRRPAQPVRKATPPSRPLVVPPRMFRGSLVPGCSRRRCGGSANISGVLHCIALGVMLTHERSLGKVLLPPAEVGSTRAKSCWLLLLLAMDLVRKR